MITSANKAELTLFAQDPISHLLQTGIAEINNQREEPIDLNQDDDILSELLGAISKIFKSKETGLSSFEKKSIHLDQSPQISNPLENTKNQGLTKTSVNPDIFGLLQKLKILLSNPVEAWFSQDGLDAALNQILSSNIFTQNPSDHANHLCLSSIIPKSFFHVRINLNSIKKRIKEIKDQSIKVEVPLVDKKRYQLMKPLDYGFC